MAKMPSTRTFARPPARPAGPDEPAPPIVDIDLNALPAHPPWREEPSTDTWHASSYDLLRGLKVNDFTDTFDDGLFNELFEKRRADW